MRKVIVLLVMAGFCVAASPALAQLGAVKKGVKKTGEATVDATKTGAKATEKGTKKAAQGTKDAVQRTFACNDGKTDQATLKANACKEHGGVKPDPPKATPAATSKPATMTKPKN
jgi:hypothetical protein